MLSRDGGEKPVLIASQIKYLISFSLSYLFPLTQEIEFEAFEGSLQEEKWMSQCRRGKEGLIGDTLGFAYKHI